MFELDQIVTYMGLVPNNIGKLAVISGTYECPISFACQLLFSKINRCTKQRVTLMTKGITHGPICTQYVSSEVRELESREWLGYE